MAGYDFDSLTIDLQHGLVDYQTALTMLQAMTTSGITPMARVPWNEPGIIMKLLDGGHGIICPMVNTAEDAQAFVGAMRCIRRIQIIRASGHAFHGGGYHDAANETLVSLAMIERLRPCRMLTLFAQQMVWPEYMSAHLTLRFQWDISLDLTGRNQM